MKKIFIAALIALLTLTYCSKQRSGHYNDSDMLITQARAYLESQPSPDTPYIPLWSQAYIQTLSFGKAVVLPLHLSTPLYILVGGQRLNADRLTWLILYKDSALHWQAQVVTRIPDDNLPGRYQGKIRVENWQRQFQKAYYYKNDSVATYTQSTRYKRPEGAAAPRTAPTLAAITYTCTTTDWYACYTYDGIDAGCDYAYTEEDCEVSSIAPISSGGSNAPTPTDYLTIGGAAPSVAKAPTPDIKADPSITANPIILCVYNNLMAPDLPHGLNTVLKAFNDNNTYNLTFTLTPGLPEDGNTHYDGAGNWTIQLNAAEADDPTYSRIYLAATMIHEAFHAKLRQKAVATFGQAAINDWPTPIDDMDLTQLANYFEQESKANNTWETVEHDWMVDNITDMATTLESFVQTYYGATYAEAGSALAPYLALMYMGLQNSTLYQEQIVATGLQPTVQSYWGLLNDGGTCSN